MIIAIYGKSCTGKTMIARNLAKSIKAKVHFCGEEVKKRAKQLNIKSTELSEREHYAIDHKTREIARSERRDIVIEGIFLPYVLEKIKNIYWLELICDDVVRNTRYLKKEGNFNKTGLAMRDVFDHSLFEKLYWKNMLFTKDIITIDTTSKSVDELVTFIKTVIRNHYANET